MRSEPTSPFKYINSYNKVDGKNETSLVHDKEQIYDIKGNSFKQTLFP